MTLVLILAILLVGLAISQPFWEQLLDREPLPFINNLTDLVAINVMILSIALAAFGAIAYNVLLDRVRTNVDSEVRKRVSEVRSTMKVEMHLMQAFIWWNQYDDWWDQNGYRDQNPTDVMFGLWLDQCVDLSRRALDTVRDKMPEGPERQQLEVQALNTLAYHLGTRRTLEDKVEALALALELDPHTARHPARAETVVWVRLRCSTDQDERTAAIERGLGLLDHRRLPIGFRQRLRRKYETLWPEDFNPPILVTIQDETTTAPDS